MFPLFLKKLLCNLIPVRDVRKRVRKRVVFAHYIKIRTRKCKVGFDSYVGKGLEVANKKTTIGKYCSIARFVCIGTGQHPTDLLSTHPMLYKDMPYGPNLPPECRCKYDDESPPCHIGNDVWIGRGAVIMDGLTVGDGAIVATSAIVTKDVPPYAIVGGVPAKLIRYRFPPDIIEALLELRWWDLPVEKIKDLPFNDVPRCVEELRKIRAAEAAVGTGASDSVSAA